MTRRKTPPHQVLFLEDLARSGLTAEDAKRLKLRLLEPRAVVKLTEGQHRGAAYKIPYYDPTGKDTGYFRLRLLTELTGPKASRYWQPRGSLPRLFFPRTRAFDLAKALADVTEPLYITEGEKKADRACLAGLVTVSVGGVWSWKSPRLKTPRGTLEDLDLIEWKDRQVFLAFDSDVATKPDVQAALRALAREVAERGARPRSIKLPGGLGDAKVGLDDFLEAQGRPAFDALEREVLDGNLAEELWRLNEELVCIESPPAVWRLRTREFLTRDQLDTAYKNRKVVVPGERGARQVQVAKEWLAWGLRREAPRVTFSPGQAGFLEDGSVNLWRGWAVESRPGSVQPWEDLLSYLFHGADEARRWFEDWCAYPLQNPGVKMYSAVVLVSLRQGVGKSLLGETFRQIYGDAFIGLDQEALSGPFNPWAVGKLFALGDEVTGSDKRRDADRLKNLITREVVTVNLKYQPQYALPDRLNYLFTTNHPDAFSLEKTDRRFFIHEIRHAPKSDSFYQTYDAWMRSPEGAGALFHYLQHRNLADFNPKKAPPWTESKDAMERLSRSDLETFARRLREDPDGVLRLDGQVAARRSLFTIDELLVFADPEGRRHTSHKALANALRRTEFREVGPVTTSMGSSRLWPIRDEARWWRATHAELKAEREREIKPLTLIEGGKKY